MIRRLIRLIRRYSTATSESETDYGGFGSWAGEYHAIEYGLPLGLLTGLTMLLDPRLGTSMATLSAGIVLEAMHRDAPSKIPLSKGLLRQIRKELHYYLGSWAIGFAPFVPLIGVETLVARLPDVLSAVA